MCIRDRIDAEHKQLFDAINDLMDACAQGVGREKIMSTTQFLNSYVNKHFGDEEKLQVQSKYPGYAAHKPVSYTHLPQTGIRFYRSHRPRSS